jgi:hypothetical protein
MFFLRQEENKESMEFQHVKPKALMLIRDSMNERRYIT